jgi:hypothetical protein
MRLINQTGLSRLTILTAYRLARPSGMGKCRELIIKWGKAEPAGSFAGRSYAKHARRVVLALPREWRPVWIAILPVTKAPVDFQSPVEVLVYLLGHELWHLLQAHRHRPLSEAACERHGIKSLHRWRAYVAKLPRHLTLMKEAG